MLFLICSGTQFSFFCLLICSESWFSFFRLLIYSGFQLFRFLICPDFRRFRFLICPDFRCFRFVIFARFPILFFYRFHSDFQGFLILFRQLLADFLHLTGIYFFLDIFTYSFFLFIGHRRKIRCCYVAPDLISFPLQIIQDHPIEWIFAFFHVFPVPFLSQKSMNFFLSLDLFSL